MSAACSRGRTALPKSSAARAATPPTSPPCLTAGKNDDTRLYHKLLLQREGEVYYGTLSRWCEAHGIGLMGHPHQSDDIEVEKYFAVPGQDLVLRWLAPEKDGLAGIDSTMGKCSADAARLMHRRRNANECFGACNKDDNPWQLSGGDIKWYTDWLAVRGSTCLSRTPFITASAASARTSARLMSVPTASGGRITRHGAPTGGGCPG